MPHASNWLLGMALIMVAASCQDEAQKFDASGAFEANEVVVSAQQTGQIMRLTIEEGQSLDSNAVVGSIDVAGLKVQRQQAEAAVGAISQKVNSASPQINVLQSQISTQQAQIATIQQQKTVLNKEIVRTQNLVKLDAATPKQLDDLQGQQAVLDKQISAAQQQLGVLQQQIAAAKENVQLQNKAILSEVNPAQKKIAVIDEQIGRSNIVNVVKGTVLSKYAMAGEFTATGKPLYKIADLSTLTLRAYITGDQLPLVKLNQNVKVLTDDGKGGYHSTTGTVTWISDRAEFTPKTIQTKNERANTVYAMKIKVKNDGTYKIGMYGEILFQ